jgi:predicted metal-dependent phosphoesterase TrpH
MSVDLHIHSTASDGTQTPAEIVREASDRGLFAIAIADHDTVGGVAPAIEAARGLEAEGGSRQPLAMIPAVELSAEQGRHEAHILGYFIDVTAGPLLEKLGAVRQARVERAQETVRKLQAAGVRIAWEDVTAGLDDLTSIGRPHVAAALVRTGACKEPQEAFVRYLKRDRPAFVPRYKMTVAEAIETVRAAGGIPVLAHPGLIGSDGFVGYAIELGVEGLEAYHTDHSPSTTERFIKLAEEAGLLVTGGTDSHGPAGPKPVEIGSLAIPDSCAAGLIDRARETGRLRGYIPGE